MTKTILITGATDGIGRLTAQMLADAGHTVLLHGRNPEKLAATAADIGTVGGTYAADLSSLSETRALAQAVRAEHARIDVLINNAGVYKMANPVLPDGMDARFVVNTLAPYVLTKALLPIIPTDGRVVNLSSAAQARVSIDALRGKARQDHMAAYAQSKLAITVWTAEMARTHPDGPVFLAINPGSLLASKMVKEGFGVAGHDLSIGASILSQAALDDGFAQHSGHYFDNDAGSFSRPNSAAGDASHVAEIMQAIDDLTAD